jgi:4-amino-4-deoxy-L-arabinose transferase-like glycosyltransferase
MTTRRKKPTAAAQRKVLVRDAKNRALRTLVVGLGLDILAAVSLVVYDALQDDQPDYRLLGAAVLKTAMSTAASYFMRRYLDRSKIPTPLPPGDPGEPDDDTPA